MKAVQRLFFVTMLVFLVGCSDGSADDLEPFDHSALEEELNAESFQPKLPAQLPYEVEDYNYTPGPMSQKDTLLNFEFIGKGPTIIELMTTKGDINYGDDVATEQVEVGDTQGEYGESKDESSKRLVWKEDDISYELKYFMEGSEKNITKDELIQSAESFQ
ncbi:hypothetical protein GCM10010954_27400 [Halobacillus andaensis]|uniref:DUF4367 domain-containing protein n=1 Tax=Halobacillus andaensis TaxID=1176239 RepID=A0A917B6Z7_HALAA|nr:hypothetical protein [Halobacillus andaensis]MBP2005673.1 hypothetical protein [Halobacillus andaensis]GGF26879.1 hypothetical protein GCM10010954_27400 [Halobacillus andaensis]